MIQNTNMSRQTLNNRKQVSNLNFGVIKFPVDENKKWNSSVMVSYGSGNQKGVVSIPIDYFEVDEKLLNSERHGHRGAEIQVEQKIRDNKWKAITRAADFLTSEAKRLKEELPPWYQNFVNWVEEEKAFMEAPPPKLFGFLDKLKIPIFFNMFS